MSRPSPAFHSSWITQILILKSCQPSTEILIFNGLRNQSAFFTEVKFWKNQEATLKKEEAEKYVEEGASTSCKQWLQLQQKVFLSADHAFTLLL